MGLGGRAGGLGWFWEHTEENTVTNSPQTGAPCNGVLLSEKERKNPECILELGGQERPEGPRPFGFTAAEALYGTSSGSFYLKVRHNVAQH